MDDDHNGNCDYVDDNYDVALINEMGRVLKEILLSWKHKIVK